MDENHPFPVPNQDLYEKDSYPKMIIVCIVIFCVLLVLIGGLMMYELVSEKETPVPPPFTHTQAAQPKS